MTYRPFARGPARSIARAGAAALLWLLLGGCGENIHDNELTALEVADATLDPEFASATQDYTAEVENAVASTTVTATTRKSNATLTVNGAAATSGTPSAPVPLSVGDNTVTVVVTDSGGDNRTYTVVITRRGAPGHNPDLASLELTAAPLDQIFDPAVTSYTATTGYLGGSTRVVAEPEDAGALLELDSAAVAAGEPSAYVTLAPGTATPVVLDVTAEDGSEIRSYQVDVTRAELETLHQEAYVKASNTGPDLFGSSVSLSRDTLIVGAPGEASAASGVDGNQLDNTFTDAGAVYVYDRSGTTWLQSAYLKAASPGDRDQFGGAVAIDGDRALVGAEGEQSLATGVNGNADDDSSSFVGAAYVFERDGAGVWSQDAYLKASNADASDSFGAAVDLDHDLAIVGAFSEDSGATGVDGDDANDDLPGSGAAYLFSHDDSGWRQSAYLKASNTDGGDEFGSSVAVSGTTAAAGAPAEDSGAIGVDGDDSDDTRADAGAVYVFDRDASGRWSQSVYLKASNTNPGDRFGASVALDGDLLAVGAPGEDGGASGVNGDQQDDTQVNAGAVYVFGRDSSGRWSQVAYLKASNPGFNDEFGSTVALSGNVLAVGAASENSAAAGLDGDQLDDSAPDSGAAYVFERDDSGIWRQILYAKSANSGAGDQFAASVAVDGDSLVSGAPLEASSDTGIDGDDFDDSLPQAGAVYVIR